MCESSALARGRAQSPPRCPTTQLSAATVFLPAVRHPRATSLTPVLPARRQHGCRPRRCIHHGCWKRHCRRLRAAGSRFHFIMAHHQRRGVSYPFPPKVRAGIGREARRAFRAVAMMASSRLRETTGRRPYAPLHRLHYHRSAGQNRCKGVTVDGFQPLISVDCHRTRPVDNRQVETRRPAVSWSDSQSAFHWFSTPLKDINVRRPVRLTPDTSRYPLQPRQSR